MSIPIFREKPYYKTMGPREREFVEALWRASLGYPIAYDREYLFAQCYPGGLEIKKVLPKTWFYKEIWNLRVSDIIDIFFSPKGEARLYFLEKKGKMEANKSGPFEEGAQEMQTCKWQRVIQKENERLGNPGQIPIGKEITDTRRNTKNVTIPPKQHSRNKWSGDCS